MYVTPFTTTLLQFVVFQASCAGDPYATDANVCEPLIVNELIEQFATTGEETTKDATTEPL